MIRAAALTFVCLMTAAVCSAQSSDQHFLMAVQDVFSISGRGTVVTGTIERGTVRTGDKIEIIGRNAAVEVTVTGIEKNRTAAPDAAKGDAVGLVLRGVDRNAVARGDALAATGSIKPYKKLEVSIDLLTASEGGRSTPVADGYRPMLGLWTRATSAVVRLPAGKDKIDPGEKNVAVTVELADATALEKGMKFTIREGSRTVGSGTITRLIE